MKKPFKKSTLVIPASIGLLLLSGCADVKSPPVDPTESKMQPSESATMPQDVQRNITETVEAELEAQSNPDLSRAAIVFDAFENVEGNWITAYRGAVAYQDAHGRYVDFERPDVDTVAFAEDGARVDVDAAHGLSNPENTTAYSLSKEYDAAHADAVESASEAEVVAAEDKTGIVVMNAAIKSMNENDANSGARWFVKEIDGEKTPAAILDGEEYTFTPQTDSDSL